MLEKNRMVIKKIYRFITNNSKWNAKILLIGGKYKKYIKN